MKYRGRIPLDSAVIAAALLLVTIPSLQAQGQPAQRGGAPGVAAPAAPTGPLAPEKYKNIQVLTTVQADQLDVTMRYVSAATGFSCVQCHVQDATSGEFAYDKDDKRNKQDARGMMKMVLAINSGNFGVQVGCATCHQGQNQPAGLTLATMLTPEQIVQANAAPAQRGAPPAGAAPAGPGGARGQQPPAIPVDDVLNKYFDAVGGRAAVEKVQSLTLTGTLTTRANQRLPFAIEEKANKYRESVQTGPDAIVRGFDGLVGWSQSGGRTTNLAGFGLDQVLRTDDLGLVLRLKEKYPALAASGRLVPVNGKDAVVVTGRAGITTDQFYFESASGLLVRHVITTRTPLGGQLREQIDYADYRALGGVKIPFQITRTNWETMDTLRVTDAKVNPAIADARFAKP